MLVGFSEDGRELGTSLGHFGEDLLDFAEDDVVLLDFPELLVFSDFFWSGGFGKGGRKGKELKKRTKVGVGHCEWIDTLPKSRQ